MKTVWIKPRFPDIPLHSMYHELSKHPPLDYRIIINQSKKISPNHNFSSKTQNSIIRAIKYNFFSIPYTLFQIYQKYDIPEKTDLIFATEHVISSPKPWIVGLEFAGSLSGYLNPDLSKPFILKKLKDKQCKFILPYSEWGKRTVNTLFPDPEIEKKIQVIRYTVSPKNFNSNTDDSVTRLLFVGTINPGNLMDYEFKGLNEILESFFTLQKKYPALELVIRSKVSNKIKKLIQTFPNIRLIDYFVTATEMDNLFKTSHIFVQAGYGTLTNSVLEAASYGLSIITIDLFNNSEFIKHKQNGLLIKIDHTNFYDKFGMPNEHSSQFIKSIRKHHTEITAKMIEMLELLIDDTNLRKKLGMNAKNSISTGEFSETNRNAVIKKIFDESLE